MQSVTIMVINTDRTQEWDVSNRNRSVRRHHLLLVIRWLVHTWDLSNVNRYAVRHHHGHQYRSDPRRGRVQQEPVCSPAPSAPCYPLVGPHMGLVQREPVCSPSPSWSSIQIGPKKGTCPTGTGLFAGTICSLLSAGWSTHGTCPT